MDGDHRHTLGARAEQLAFDYLKKRGLRPVARNFRTRRGEIDLVMRDRGVLTFIEVRYRTSNSLVDAILTVDTRKQRKLIATASLFLARNPIFRNHTCRFDVVGVDCTANDELQIKWLRDAFRT